MKFLRRKNRKRKSLSGAGQSRGKKSKSNALDRGKAEEMARRGEEDRGKGRLTLETGQWDKRHAAKWDVSGKLGPPAWTMGTVRSLMDENVITKPEGRPPNHPTTKERGGKEPKGKTDGGTCIGGEGVKAQAEKKRVKAGGKQKHKWETTTGIKMGRGIWEAWRPPGK